MRPSLPRSLDQRPYILPPRCLHACSMLLQRRRLLMRLRLRERAAGAVGESHHTMWLLYRPSIAVCQRAADSFMPLLRPPYQALRLLLSADRMMLA